ncbi:PREDICTED: O-phosphoseryl-tRNA(Sec) selenium transferase isoform X2 [Nicrophorus vespilloides]|uniref:O-phosphoseryl-tRNA(Sec) selenium transferase n=1 Tax=Nicrophorus vespilloides TaxID=110193 RepID=A0ABM1N2L4_NICVS|nr:PREDICTED: O-phosphoseryl-tRNA(Sec) selenium transferase isoform X2 [Nicrophorus vespilloides]
MNEKCMELAAQLVPKTFVKVAKDASHSREKQIENLLIHVRKEGWDDISIELLLSQLALMDSNNFMGNCGLGEREARVASSLVARRHYNFGHGIGRSGDLNEPQPKAAGSSLMYKLTNRFLEDLFKLMGIQSTVRCILVPLATGMSLVLSMMALKSSRPGADVVIWSRIDQKSCFKSISSAGCRAIVVDTKRNGDQLETDVEGILKKIKEVGANKVLCVMTTTACFAPRACDNIEEVAKLCKQFDVPHLINNAYGLQDKSVMCRIQKAQRVGRVDLLVQSTDKNLMVPVGGAIIASFDEDLLQTVSKCYPGRASGSPIMDVFITLLHLGKSGYLKLVEERVEKFKLLSEKLREIAAGIGERLLESPQNPISMAMSMSKLPADELRSYGAKLYIRSVSGTRVIDLMEHKIICGQEFKSWGSSTNDYDVPYMTAAAAIGVTDDDIDLFMKRMKKIFGKNQ